MPVSRRAAAASGRAALALGRRRPGEALRPAARAGARRPGRRSRPCRGPRPRARRGRRCRRARRPPTSASMKRVDRGLVGEAEQVASTASTVTGSSALTRTWSSIDSASRMPPPRARATSATRVGLDASRPSASRMRSSLPSISARRERSEREALEARDDGRADLARVGRAEDEEDAVGRLLERLEEDVPALLDALDLVDDEDLAAQVGRGRVDARQQLAHVVDLVVGRGVELDDVERTALADGRRTMGSGRTARRRAGRCS